MIESVTMWVALLGLPGSILIGGGAAYLRCRHRGELRGFTRLEVLAELDGQR